MLADVDLEDFPELSEEHREIENGASYSQVDTYELCQRKWAFRTIGGDKRKNKFADRGIKAHRLVAGWLAKRVPPSGMTVEGKLAQSLLLHLPTPHDVDPKNVERETILKLAGVEFFLGIDLWMPVGFARPRVFDHKTTTELKWALEQDMFREDVQATLYAAWAMVETNAPSVDVQWTYATTKGAPEPGVVSNWQPKDLAVVATLTGRDIQDRLGRSVETAREIVAWKKSGAEPMDVPYDARGCEKYGGCEFKKVCNLSPEQQLVSLMTKRTVRSKRQEQESKMAIVGDPSSLAARMAARKANGAAAAPAINPPAEAPATQPAPAGGGLAARMKARAVPAQQAAEPAQPAQLAATTQQEPAAQQEVQKRGRGRPPREQPAAAAPAPAALPPEVVGALSAIGEREERDRWTAFAAAAMSVLMDKFSVEDLTQDTTLATDVGASAATYADAMAEHYARRFAEKK